MGIAAALAAVIAVAAPDAPAPSGLLATPNFRTVGVAAGMPSSRVYKTLQDRRGFLWFGTHDGLARYDGTAFRIYRHDESDPASLAGNIVSALFVDRDDRLWCGAEETGLEMLDARRRGFTHWRHDPADPASLASDDVWTIAQDAGGAIWIGTYAGGLDRFVPGTPGFVHHRHDAADPRSLVSNNVLALLAARDGRLWVGSDAGIDVIGADGAVAHVELPSSPGDNRLNAISLLEGADGLVYAGTRRGLLAIDTLLRARLIASDGLSDRLIYTLADGKGGSDLWIGTRHGLSRRGGDGAITQYREAPAVPGAFGGESVFDAMRDREGSLWFSTLESGVDMLPASWRNFAIYRNDPADPASLGSNRPHGLGIDPGGAIWSVSLAGGIDRLDPASGRVERLAGRRLAAPDSALWSVLADRSGQLWVGHAFGIRVYDLQSGHFSDLPVDPDRRGALARGIVYHLAEDPAGALWAAAYDSAGAVHRIDPKTHEIERFDAGNAGLRDAEIDQIGFDASGALLVASGAGLDRFDAATRRFAAMPGATSNRVYAFAIAGDRSLWLHVPGALEHYRAGDGGLVLLERIGTAAGWPTLTAGGLQVDAGGRVWASSSRGLWRYDPGRHNVRRFDEHDGLANSEFTHLPLVRRADGAIFGATLAGVVGFQPAAFVDNDAAPPLVLDGIVLRRGGNDQVIDPEVRAVALRWDDRDLRVTARALSFVNPAAIRYQWRLHGFDRNWIDTGNRGEREFTQLPPGGYRLEVRAAVGSADWSAPLDALRIDVARPPWATPLAAALYALALAAIVFALLCGYRARMRRRHDLELAEQQRRFAEQSNTAKSEFLATMGHEIRTPMTGVLGMTELLLRTPLDATQRGYARTILDSGRLMLRLVNDSLDLARIEAGRLDLDEAAFDLHALLAGIGDVAAPLAAAKGLDWTSSLAAETPRRVLGDAMRIRQILLNLVNNAIKFTASGSVALNAAGSGGDVAFTVRDTGPGIPESLRVRLFERFAQAAGGQRHGGSGLGLAVCRELVAAMGGTIEADSETGTGSTFRVRLPLPVAADDGAGAEPVAVETSPDTDAAPRHVLLVEDDATVAAVVAGLLSAHGHRVTLAPNGLAALAEVDAMPNDVALIDLDLPGIDGIALARLLRTREAQCGSARLPLIGISARSAGNEEALCLDAGMDAFLRKPLTSEQLSEAVAAATNGRGNDEDRARRITEESACRR